MGGDRGDGNGVIEYTEMDKKEVHGLLEKNHGDGHYSSLDLRNRMSGL